MRVHSQAFQIFRYGLKVRYFPEHRDFFFNHRPKHRDEGAEPAPFFDQSLPDSLLLCFFQQEILIVDVLERAVQLGLDVASPEGVHFFGFLLQFQCI